MPAKKKPSEIKNRTIFTGDNLHVMRGMADESVDLIYLDPPFNSKHDYSAPIGSKAAGAAFKDTWNLSDIDEEWWGEISQEHPPLHTLLKAIKDIGGDSMMSYCIYMAVRLMEMRRILKDTGSIYLHCDTTAGHYLKLLMDSIFGAANYRNDISWKRSEPHNDAKRFGKITDNILYYQKSNARTWNVQYTDMSEKTRKMFRHVDEKGVYRGQKLTAEGLSGGGYEYEYKGHNRVWQYPKESMKRLEDEGRIHMPIKKGGLPERKYYMSEARGVPLQNIWTDIEKARGKERVGYPTQKPLALLERIISASSNPGDMVFDPFCGCATTCLAAEKLGRRWIGVDISELAAKLIKSRMLNAARAKDGEQETLDRFTKGAGEIVHRTDLPRQHAQRDPCIRNKLYGTQEGICNGCLHHFEIRHMDLDHVVPSGDGGPDADDNLQLLCSSCNRIKGKKTMGELKARLKDLKILN